MKKRNAVINIVALALLFTLASTIVLHQDKQLNSITINGNPSVSIGLNGLYKEQGARGVVDGKDISDEIEVSGDIDTSKPGEYTITYKHGSLEEKRKVIVGETMNPILTLETETQKVKLAEPVTESKATATDENGQDISSNIQIEKVEFTQAKTYQVAYSVEDSEGRGTQIFQTVEVEPNTDYESSGLAICMYHYVYDENNPPDDLSQKGSNYIEVKDLEEELAYLKEENYYFPTWVEVRDFIDGKQLLPEKSIVLSFDDGAKSFLDLGIPLLEKYQIPATCFMITTGNGAKKVQDYQSEYISYQTHSHEMHQGGGNMGRGGRISVMTEEEIIADMKTSTEICGNADAFAYPFGDYTELSRNAIEKAGLLCAVTINPGKAYPGDDPYLLNRVRMHGDQSLRGFASSI